MDKTSKEYKEVEAFIDKYNKMRADIFKHLKTQSKRQVIRAVLEQLHYYLLEREKVKILTEELEKLKANKENKDEVKNSENLSDSGV